MNAKAGLLWGMAFEGLGFTGLLSMNFLKLPIVQESYCLQYAKNMVT